MFKKKAEIKLKAEHVGHEFLGWAHIQCSFTAVC